jgi:hypothetical protein
MRQDESVKAHGVQTASPERKQTGWWAPLITPIGLALLGCLVLGFALRVWGVRFGLPQLYYWDEPTVVNRAMRFGTGDLNPHYFYYPALYMYVLFAATGVFFVAGRATGAFGSATDFAKTYFVEPTGVYMAARVTTALSTSWANATSTQPSAWWRHCCWRCPHCT